MNRGSRREFRWRPPLDIMVDHGRASRRHLSTAASIGRVGILAVALGIGTAAGIFGSTYVAHADTGDSGQDSPGSASTSRSPSVGIGVGKPTRASAAATARRTRALPGNDVSPSVTHESRGSAAARRASSEVLGVSSVSVGQSDMAPSPGQSDMAPSPASAAAVHSQLATPGDVVGTSESVVGPVAVTGLGLPKSSANVVRIPAVTLITDGAAALSRMGVRSLADQALAVTAPPMASAAASVTPGSFLASLFAPQRGGAPAVPAEAATALLAGAVWRQRDLATELLRWSATQPAAEAAAPDPVTIEAETMTVSGAGRWVVDSRASGGSAIALDGVGAISTTVTLPDTTVLTVRVRASEGAPNMTVMIDGETVTTLLVEARSYSDYKFAGAIAAGSHEISIESSTSTTRNVLYVDTLIATAGPIVDEFVGKSGSAPDSGIWTVRSGVGFDSGIQTYDARNAVLDGKGHLVLQALKTKTGEYTSGWVWSKNNVSFGYGTLTARIKMPKGQGLWPAFWLMGADSDTVGWPASGEIDVAELPSTSTTIYSTLHGPIAGGAGTQQAQIVSNVTDMSTGYHNYWVRHVEDEITFGVDDRTLGTLTPDSLDPDETWVYNRPMYAILNLGVGGPWAGAPTRSTRFPAKMMVDSVRWEAA